jgi:hypothetical protein
MNKNIRIRTTPGGKDNYVKIKIDQDFDFLEILSLKISQQEIYRTFCADYGVVVGRVIANNGFGVQNAKVSVFIPITDDDKNNSLISGLYPFTSVSDKDNNGVRYNLLPKESQGECHNPVGTISSKREFLDNDVLIEIYDKYYKFTTTTNSAGDYLIFGVPVGNYNLHIDVDISDIGGAISQRPYDMIRQGSSPKLFESPTKFKAATNLDSLVQIKSVNRGITIQPFWGDKNNCDVGITRADIDINYHFEPQAIFIGALFSDNEKNSINKNCRPRTKLGELCDMTPSQGTIKMIRKTIDGNVESFDVDGGRLIDNNGTWAYQIPMNLDYVITDEFGRIIPSDDPSKGVPTRAEVRFKISTDVTGGEGRLRTRASYLIPNNPLDTEESIDYSFDETTSRDSSFVSLRWNKLYSVKNYIARFQPNTNASNTNYIGIKKVDDCGSHTPFPYNRVATSFNPLYMIICLILAIIIDIIFAINYTISLINSVIIQVIRDIIEFIAGIGVPLPDILFSWSGGIKINWRNKYYFSGLRSLEPDYIPCISLECPSSSGEFYAPGCNGPGYDVERTNKGGILENSRNRYSDCVELELGKALDIFQFDFYNDWVNGSLYLPLLKYKHNDYCNVDCGGNCHTSYLVDTCVSDGVIVDDIPVESAANKEYHLTINEGIVKNYKDELFYAPRYDNGKYPLYPTDIILLGSTLPCDLDGIPTIHNKLIPTTYKMPEIIDPIFVDTSVDPNDEIGIDPLFFKSISCFSFYSNIVNCRNINTTCEIGIDLSNSGVSIDTIVNENINDKTIRQDIIGMASNTTNYNSIDDHFRSTDNTIYYTQSSFVSNDYSNYRNMIKYNDSFNVSRGGSLYFYFGIVPGKSSLEAANLKYFTECIIPPIKTLTINGTIINNIKIGGDTGSINLNVLGGSGNYNYHWDNGLIGNTITGLTAGNYTVTVTETSGLGLTDSRLFTVTEPAPLFFYLTTTASTISGSNGIISVNNIIGGIPTYTAELRDNSDALITSQSVIGNSSIFTGLNNQIYKIRIIDSQLPTNNYLENSISVTSPNLLIASVTSSNILCNDSHNGIVNVLFTGGTPPYTNTLTNGILTYTGFTINNLSAGTYTNTLKDSTSPQQIITSSITITSPAILDYIINVGKITCHSSNDGSIIFTSTSGGVGPYEYSIDNGTTWSTTTIYPSLLPGTYITAIKDNNGCTLKKGDIDITYNVGLIAPPVLNNTSSGGLQQLVLNANGGDSTNYTFTVSGGDPLILGSQAYNGSHFNPILPKTFTFALTGATTYDVSVVDNNGCLADKSGLSVTI